MFRPQPMMRLRAIILEKDEKICLCELGHLEVIQLSRARVDEDVAPWRPSDRTLEVDRCDRLKTRIDDLQRKIGVSASMEHPTVRDTAFDDAERDLQRYEERANRLVQQREEYARQKQELDVTDEKVGAYGGMELRLDQGGAGMFLKYLPGTLPQGTLAAIHSLPNAVLIPLAVRQQRQRLLVVTTCKNSLVVEGELRRLGFERDEWPVIDGATVDALLEKTHTTRQHVMAQLLKIEEQIQALALEAAPVLTALRQWTQVERWLYQAEACCVHTDASVLITGWVPENEVSKTVERLHACTGGRCAVEFTSARSLPEEDVPVLLRHAWWLRPFELLIKAYGLPKYREVAPTLFVAVSYMLMFGMMFGDVGHGGMLVLLGLLWHLTQRRPEGQKIGLLLLFNGLASVGFGVVYGSYFGIPALRHHALWRDPLDGDPMTLMLLAISMGVVLMSVGLILNVVNRLTRGDLFDGLMDKHGLMGLVFYWTALVLFIQWLMPQKGHWTWNICVFLVVLSLACWWLKEPLRCLLVKKLGPGMSHQNIGVAATESFVGVFEGMLTYLSNTISFVRLAAYAMSHAALLAAIYTMATEMRRFGEEGARYALLVVVLGNMAAMLLEGVVAAVQALRLEFYEFFGKFHSGEGQPFRPFSLDSRAAGNLGAIV